LFNLKNNLIEEIVDVEIVDVEIVDVEIVYHQFPKTEALLAEIDSVSEYYQDEFEEVASEEQLKNIKDWSLYGIGVDSPGTYYVMDLVKVFMSKKTGEFIMFNDHDINSGGIAFTPFRSEDMKSISIYRDESQINQIKGLLW